MDQGLTLLSAFTGAGGMDSGLEAAGFGAVGCIEFENDPRDTIRKNRDWRLLDPPDITELSTNLTAADVGLARAELDLLAAGPPCQPFSAAAQWTASGRNGLNDDRRANALFSLFDLIEELLPRAVLIENVPGFVKGPTSAAAWIGERVSRINQQNAVQYTLHSNILNAADFGVPQKRRRAMVVLLRDSDHFIWPTPFDSDRQTTAWDAIGHLAVPDPPKASGEWADLLPSIPEGYNYLWHTDRGGGLPLFGYRTRYWSFLLKLSKERPSWTIPAQSGPATGPFHWDNRPLHLAEVAALQTFSNTWQFAGTARSAVRQVGNATPPLLAEVMGRSLRDALRAKPPLGPLVHAIRRSNVTPPAEPPSMVPAKYLHLTGEHQAHPGTGMGPAPRHPTA